MRQYRDKYPEKAKSAYLQERHSLSLGEYAALKETQGGVCAICKNPETTINKKTGKEIYLAVDHDHTTGKIRGLLCRRCNMSIGHFEENIEFLAAAINYLTNNKPVCDVLGCSEVGSPINNLFIYIPRGDKFMGHPNVCEKHELIFKDITSSSWMTAKLGREEV